MTDEEKAKRVIKVFKYTVVILKYLCFVICLRCGIKNHDVFYVTFATLLYVMGSIK